uniref:Uncharacterized protein n=1 Tax=Tanacetum cinerariifolium TaxID=118510 RepID=A0A6L2NHX8_TANCI|nr:hypothetical protein [Tanacetum cinerariifolium]
MSSGIYLLTKSKSEFTEDVSRCRTGRGGDRGSDDYPPPYQPNLGGKKAGKAITDKSGPVLIWFEVDYRETLMPLGDHAAHWPTISRRSLGSCPCTTLLGTKCHRSRRRGSCLTYVLTWNPTAGHKSMRASSSTCKRSTMVRRLLSNKDIGFLKRTHISETDCDKQLAFWIDPKNLARAAQNKQNRAKSKVVCRQGSRSIAAL